MERVATGWATALLASDEPPPVALVHETGISPVFLTCDHAGRRLPRSLGTLGLPQDELVRHIAWDIGAEATARLLADRLDACLAAQVYSRLAIDCNRPPGVAELIVERSELTDIPGNRGLSAAARAARVAEIFAPYHARIEALLDRRRSRDQRSVLVAMHSFTPVFKGCGRPWHIGILYNRDARLGRILLDLLRAERDLTVGDNEPYGVDDESDYTIPVHGERRGLAHVEIEIRQDLIVDEVGQRAWAERLSRLLPASIARLDATEKE